MRQATAQGLVLLVATLGVAATGCGGKDDQKSFEVVLQDGETVNDIFNRTITKASEMCFEDAKLQVVSWKFAKGDLEKPIVQEYTNGKNPVYIECRAVRPAAGAATTKP